ncbi:unannotated protein [freshwater metagenome]|uniref:Unannotated protein n=1 Tax=freshwater metagenome TaxID=449393 RepID=A0A6J6UZD0_9ZZZZ
MRSVDLGVELQILSYFEQMRLETGGKSENAPQLNSAGAR